MSPGSGVKSEYMKRYREPRWDEYAQCYRELLRYRLGRRLLEQAHAPWLWDAWGPDGASDGSISASPAPGCAAGEPAEPSAREERPAARRGAEAGGDAGGDAGAEEQRRTAEPTAPPTKDVEEKPEPQSGAKETDRLPSSSEPRQQPSALFARGSKKAAKSPQRATSRIRENKHPFALYGWGEKQTDTGNQKTHNVCASASVHEIHESALRAKNRRQVEKRKLATQRQRAHSVDVEKNRRLKPSSVENPWLTEYMRCYSARA